MCHCMSSYPVTDNTSVTAVQTYEVATTQLPSSLDILVQLSLRHVRRKVEVPTLLHHEVFEFMTKMDSTLNR